MARGRVGNKDNAIANIKTTLNPKDRAFIERYIITGDLAGTADALGYAKGARYSIGKKILAKKGAEEYERAVRKVLYDRYGGSDPLEGAKILTRDDNHILLKLTRASQLTDLEEAKGLLQDGLEYARDFRIFESDIKTGKGVLPRYSDSLVKIIETQNKMLGFDKPEGESDKDDINISLNFKISDKDE